MDNLSVTGGLLGTSADLTIRENLTLGATSFAITDGDPNVTLSGSDVLNDAAVGFGNGTLTATGDLNMTRTNLTASGDATLTLDTTEAATLRTLTLDTAFDEAVTVSLGPSSLTFDRLTGNGVLQWDGGEGDFVIAGTAAPGNSIGWMDVGGSVTMQSGSTYEWELGADGADEFSVADLNLGNGGTWTLKLGDAGAPIGPFAGGPQVLFEYATLAGDTLGDMVLDQSAVERWVFDAAGPQVVNDSQNHLIVLQGLDEILAMQWKTDGNGSFGDPANWFDAAVPEGVDAVANFLDDIVTAGRTVSVDSPATVGTINFDNATHSFEIAGPSTIVLKASAGDAQINVQAGSHTISAQLSPVSSLTVGTADTTSLTIAPATRSFFDGDLTKNGMGDLAFSNYFVTGALNHQGGSLTLGEDVLTLQGGPVTIGAGLALHASGHINRQVIGTLTPAK
ncbi:hypothetical protein LCGC14_1581970, partial [marine sediment metagenome]